MFLHAAWVLPIDRPPLRDGWVEIVAGCIRAIHERPPPTGNDAVVELAEHVLLPGLVNAHTHLDLASVATPFPARDGFVPWLDAVIAHRRTTTHAALECGRVRATRELLASGVTCIGDFVGDPRWLAALAATPFRGIAFLEVIGCTPARAAAQRDTMTMTATACPWPHRITPHAPYSVEAAMLRSLLTAPQRHPPLAIHCAESPEEWALCTTADGPLFTQMEQFGRREITTAASPLQFLDAHGPLPSGTCLIHCNDLLPQDIALLRERRCTVIHCPPSHAHCGFRPFPLDALRAAGIPIALGTDSHASAPTIGLLAALRQLRAAHPRLDAAQLVRMATLGGAAALGLDADCGSLTPGKCADLVSLRLHDRHADPYENVLLNETADRVWIAGEETHAH